RVRIAETDNTDGTIDFTRTADGLEYHFEPIVTGSGQFRLSALIDHNGYRTTLAYSTQLGYTRLQSVTDPEGRALTFSYMTTASCPFRLLTGITDSAGRSVSFGYDTTNCFLTSVTDVAGKKTSFTYDTHRRLLTMKDP